MKNIAISSHTALIGGKEYDGIGNVLTETMAVIPTNYIFVRHSMDGRLPSVTREYCASVLNQEHRLHVLSGPAPVRYISELFSTLWYFTFNVHVDCFIGVDPLNALAAVLLKKIGRVNYCVFFTPDYSPKRFDNKTLDNIYHAIDKYCVKYADEVWSVSTRIQAVRREQGFSESKNILVPNVPPEKYKHLKKNTKNKYRLITSGVIDKQLDFFGTLEAMKILESEFPELELIIVGNGPEEERVKAEASRLGLSAKVHLPGHLPLSESLSEVSKSGIGLSLYTGEWGFNLYGDSTKCREYAFFGLPIVTTDTHSTVDEIEESGSGIVVKQNPKEYAEAIGKILNNYKLYSEESSRLGARYAGIHKKLLQRLLGDRG